MALDESGKVSLEEVQMAARNHGLPLEALRYPVTPVGLHYLLTHYDIPAVDPAEFLLEVDGLVERPLSLSLDEIRGRPSAEVVTTMECAGNGRARLHPRPVSQPWLQEAVGTARWRGTPLASVLEEAGPAGDAVEVVFTGLDHGLEGQVEQDFQRSLTVEDALGSGALLVYEMNGAPLLPQHGAPLRLVVPGWYGMTNVKWLARITAVAEPFHGYQQAHSYRLRQEEDDPGDALTRILPRALMIPPGFPEFETRRRIVPAGACVLRGRAWSGWDQVVWVGVSADAGRTWAEASIERDLDSPWAWSGWSYEWDATPGEHVLSCRARDAAGNEQPLDGRWSLGGYGNNAVQHVPVTVV